MTLMQTLTLTLTHDLDADPNPKLTLTLKKNNPDLNPSYGFSEAAHSPGMHVPAVARAFHLTLTHDPYPNPNPNP